MKNLSIFLISIFFVGCITAQKVQLELSKELRIEDKKRLTGHLYSDKTGHYMSFVERATLFNPSLEVYIEKYDRKFNQVFSKNYKVDEDNVYSLGLQYFKDKFIWIQYQVDKRNDDITFYAIPIDLNGKAGKAKQIARFKYENRKDFPNIEWKINKDTTKLIFIAEMDRNDKKEQYSAYYSVIDSDLNELWTNKIKMKESQRMVSAFSYSLGADNNIYFIAKIFDDNASSGILRQTFSKDVEYDMNVVKVSEEGSKRFKLNLRNKFIKGIRIVENPFDSDLTCAAMTGDSRKGPIQGISYFKLNSETGEFTFKKQRNFSNRELDSFGKKNTSKDRRTNERGLDADFLFQEIIYKKDGSFTLVAEDYQEIVTYNNNTNSYSTTFLNNHIITANFDSEGDVESIRMIPKRYRSRKSGRPDRHVYEEQTHYMFFATLNAENTIYYLYNDDEKNFSRNITDPDRYKTVTNFGECVAVISHIDENGKLHRKELFKKEDTGTLLMPKFSTEISENELFVFLKKPRFLSKDSFRFGVLTIQEE